MAVGNDLPLLQSSVKDVLNFRAEGALDTAQGQAASIQQQGDTTEAGLYGTAASIAGNNATLEGVAGNITDIQQQRQVAGALGKQAAATSANGFGTGGSALYLARDSMQQGYLTHQLTQTQTQINVGGFLEQKTAAETEQAAAQTAAASAGVLAGAYNNAGAIATANAANETQAVNNQLSYDKQAASSANGGTLTPYQQATYDTVTAALTGNPIAPADVSSSATPQQIFGGDATTGVDGAAVLGGAGGAGSNVTAGAGTGGSAVPGSVNAPTKIGSMLNPAAVGNFGTNALAGMGLLAGVRTVAKVDDPFNISKRGA